jgi:hypothetical protein
MELVPAPNLDEIVRTRGPLPPARVAAIALRVLDAMVAAQAAGVQHRDIKPANILVTDEGRVVLTDFGIARHVDDATLTQTGMLIGSPNYLAPERARGRTPTGLEPDLWSLGATMYDAVEGRPPFARNGPLPTLAAIVMDEPEPAVHAGPLQPVIDGLLVKDPLHRLDADRTRALLERIVRGLPAPRASVGEAVPTPASVGEAAASVGEAVPTRAEPVASRDAGLEPDVRPEARSDAPPEVPPQPERRSPGRRRVLIAGLVVFVLAVAAGVLLPRALSGRSAQVAAPASSRPASPSPEPASASATATATSAPATTAAPSTAPATTAPGSTAPGSTGAAVAAPAGFTRYTDPRDRFSVVVPAGWRPVRRDTRVDFDDPASGRFLRVDTSDTPLADPYQNWIDYERTFRQGKGDYRLLGIRRVPDYRPGAGWSTADWEFTLGGTHVLDRNIRVSDARAHALYWSTPSSEWGTAESSRIFALAAASFVPAPAG